MTTSTVCSCLVMRIMGFTIDGPNLREQPANLGILNAF